MLPSSIAALPSWLVFGALLGVAASVGVAGLFVLTDRYFAPKSEPRARVTADARRRQEIRGYLDSIGESFAEDRVVADQTVAFYLPTRDVAITFDPRAYYRLERTETYPVLMEHELPGIHIGARLPFETPDPDETTAGHNRVPEIDQAAATAFAELGVPAGASEQEVKAAYRERVKQVHPDQGGDEQAFKRICEAYDTAKQYAS